MPAKIRNKWAIRFIHIVHFHLVITSPVCIVEKTAQKKERAAALSCGAYGTRTRDLRRDRPAF